MRNSDILNVIRCISLIYHILYEAAVLSIIFKVTATVSYFIIITSRMHSLAII